MFISQPRPHAMHTTNPTEGHPASRFIAGLILPGTDQTGALAILDHAGELILHAPLPVDVIQDARDPEGLLAHLTHFVPSHSAVTDLVVSWLPASIDDPAAPVREASSSTTPPSSAARVLCLLAWLGPIPRVVAPATWLAHYGLHPDSSETLWQACTRRLPGLLLSSTRLRMTDDVRAAVLLAQYVLPLAETARLANPPRTVDAPNPGSRLAVDNTRVHPGSNPADGRSMPLK